MFSRFQLILLFSLVVFPAGQAIAGVSIKTPKSNAVWSAGEKAKIEFTSSRAVTKTRVKVSSYEKSRKPYFDDEVMPEGTDLATFFVKVPETNAGPGKTETVIIEVQVTQHDGTTSSDQIKVQIKVQIKNPPAGGRKSF